ncbi:MAG: lipopolysaccharide heptosyltransferase II [Gammaproteobacteria bacterium]|nr:lipopolysaccharide heptosyltransferase II [Gammaproteobacteria bacterium]
MTDRILVVSPSWVGDMVMAQTLYKLLRRRHRDAEIDVIAPPASLSLVTRMTEINRGILFDVAHAELGIGKRRRLGESLRKESYRQAIILPNSLKSALVPYFADIPVRTAFRGEYRYLLVNDMRMLDKKAQPRMIDRFAALGLDREEILPALDYPSLEINEHNRERLQNQFGLTAARPVMGICPGAEFGDAKKWPEHHYAKLADAAIERGMQVWIFGGPKDQTTTQQIKALMTLVNLEHCVDLSGRTSLLDAVDLLSLCGLVVSNDSGLMHVAAAVGCATAVIYGSTSSDFTPPLTDRLDILSIDLSCSPCFKRTCRLGHKNCLNQLMPDRLIPIIEKYRNGLRADESS